MRAVVVLALVLTGCASTPPATAQKPWRDVATDCYAQVQAGRAPSYAGRSGLAACDRYVEDNRYEEARRDAQDRMLLQHLLNDPQPFPQQQAPPPRQPVNCRSFVYGNVVQTRCY